MLDFDELESNLKAGEETTRLKAIKQIITSPNMGEEEAIRFLRILNDPLKDSSVAVRYYARKALSRLRGLIKGQDRHLILPQLLDENAMIPTEAAPTYVYGSKEFWFYELGSIDYKMRVKAVMAICENLLQKEDAYVKVRELFKSESHEHVIATIVKYLPRFKRKEIFEFVVPYLKHEDWRVRANCIEGLETLGDDRAVPKVLPYLTDPDNRIKGNALRYLVASHVKEVQKAVKEMLDSTQEWMRDSALFLLNKVEFSVSEELLLYSLRDESPEVVRKAISILSQQANTAKSRGALSEMAKNSKVDAVRAAAAEAVQAIDARLG